MNREPSEEEAALWRIIMKIWLYRVFGKNGIEEDEIEEDEK